MTGAGGAPEAQGSQGWRLDGSLPASAVRYVLRGGAPERRSERPLYESFFGLQELPFSLSPNPRFLWFSETHEEGFAALYYGITTGKGFILMTGAVGSGKTTLLRAVVRELPGQPNVALVHNTADLHPMDLLKLLLRDFGVPPRGETKGDHLVALNEFLLAELARDVPVVLILDEAQNLDWRTLEEVRLLSNLETDDRKLLQIVLTGQPELLTKLADPRLRQLRQRIAVEHQVAALELYDVERYLLHRVDVAGGDYTGIFAADLEPIFYEASGGSPRMINLLADRSLLAAFSAQQRPVPRSIVERQAEQLIGSFSPPVLAPTSPPGRMAET